MGLTLGTQHESLPTYSTSRVVKSFGKNFVFNFQQIFFVHRIVKCVHIVHLFGGFITGLTHSLLFLTVIEILEISI
jgi:hypothetical protein